MILGLVLVLGDDRIPYRVVKTGHVANANMLLLEDRSSRLH
jgi:hypothetical protein